MLASAIQAALAGGKVIKKNYTKKAVVSFKDANNIVTDTDKEAEAAILKVIRMQFPNHSIFSEESGAMDKDSDYRWVIDPLDGTTNFSRKLSHFSVSIALLYKNIPHLAVVYNPLDEELFTAEAGKGAQLNNEPIYVSKDIQPEKAIISLGRGSSTTGKVRHSIIYSKMAQLVRSTRVTGSTVLQLCYTACGRFDAHINNDSNFYDCAAGQLIAREAGATVTDFKGKPPQFDIKKPSDILITIPNLHHFMVSTLADINQLE